MDHRDHQTVRCRQGVPVIASPMGGRANDRLAQPQPPPREGLRGVDRERHNLALHRFRQAARSAARQGVNRTANSESDSYSQHAYLFLRLIINFNSYTYTVYT